MSLERVECESCGCSGGLVALPEDMAARCTICNQTNLVKKITFRKRAYCHINISKENHKRFESHYSFPGMESVESQLAWARRQSYASLKDIKRVGSAEVIHDKYHLTIISLEIK